MTNSACTLSPYSASASDGAMLSASFLGWGGDESLPGLSRDLRGHGTYASRLSDASRCCLVRWVALHEEANRARHKPGVLPRDYANAGKLPLEREVARPTRPHERSTTVGRASPRAFARARARPTHPTQSELNFWNTNIIIPITKYRVHFAYAETRPWCSLTTEPETDQTTWK